MQIDIVTTLKPDELKASIGRALPERVSSVTQIKFQYIGQDRVSTYSVVISSAPWVPGREIVDALNRDMRKGFTPFSVSVGEWCFCGYFDLFGDYKEWTDINNTLNITWGEQSILQSRYKTLNLIGAI